MSSGVVSLSRLLRPYWRLLLIALIAMVIAGGADLLEPWPFLLDARAADG